MADRQTPYQHFTPRKMASWVTVLEDILWPAQDVMDKIEQRAKGFKDAGIDTAINFGFHLRFDFSDYFEQLHGYYRNVCESLHRYGIRYMDHYSCNLVERPRTERDFFTLHNAHRHHVLLHKDPKAAAHAQYEGHLFHDICEKRVEDGLRGYSPNYQAELFCHNNPNFLAMHEAYLKRLFSDVPLDGLEIDDMCDYGAFSTCCCEYCTTRFKKEKGHTLPSFEDKNFWGDTSKVFTAWGNYENPAFRDWVKMKYESVRDHIKMVKRVLGNRPLMTCCSATGPMTLNGLGLNLERFMDDLDLLMLENCGMDVNTVRWEKAEPEAMLQKNIAMNMGGAPAIALSYSAYEKSAYLGWALARFWGVSNWASTLVGRLSKDPKDIKEIHEMLAPYHAWEDRYSPLDPYEGNDVTNVRLVNNLYCRENGHRNEEGLEHWQKNSEWSVCMLHNQVGYRFLRYDELSDAKRLKAEQTPLIIDNAGCISNRQFEAIQDYLQNGGLAVIVAPFGTKDENGFLREISLLEMLKQRQYPGLTLILDEKAKPAHTFQDCVKSAIINPTIEQIEGEDSFCLRLRAHKAGYVIHMMNRAIQAIAHPYLTSATGSTRILQDIQPTQKSGIVRYVIETPKHCSKMQDFVMMSPETGRVMHAVQWKKTKEDVVELAVAAESIGLYAVIFDRRMFVK